MDRRATSYLCCELELNMKNMHLVERQKLGELYTFTKNSQ